ncbi:MULTISPECIES: TerB family tellurite resistance protein [Alphaproteobacteria]|uniref:TerB family tellurite resistance protein n=1 Tax=Alphaproteobacteria TaxID=28211 RepID=UPI00329A1007
MKDDDINKVFSAGVTASIMMALIDDELAPEERERLIELSSGYGRGIKSPKEILENIEKHVSLVEELDRNSWASVINSMTKDFSDESKKIVLHGAGNMCLVDGHIDERETNLIIDIGHWMEMPQALFREWTDEFAETMRDARVSGLIDPRQYL